MVYSGPQRPGRGGARHRGVVSGEEEVSALRSVAGRWCGLLVRLEDKEHRLFITIHHIIFDRASLTRVFLQELYER
jgi:hypothetical protein